MGARPSKPTDSQLDALSAQKQELIERAARAIAQSDVLLLATGAGWSADSSLAVYKDVADFPCYRERGLTYHDICQPQWLADEPALFYGFWGGCSNDYRNATPHEGYGLVAAWRSRLHAQTATAVELRELQSSHGGELVLGGQRAGAFFSYTSNVDAHTLRSFGANECFECHGNTEVWQCADRRCGEPATPKEEDEPAREDEEDQKGAVLARVFGALKAGRARTSGERDASDDDGTGGGGGALDDLPARWATPPGFRFAVDEESRLAAGDVPPAAAAAAAPAADVAGSTASLIDRSFASNWPRCIRCGGAARPAVLMFSDSNWREDRPQHDRWDAWRNAVLTLAQRRASANPEAPLRVAVLEVGCGGNVTTVRQASESLVQDVNGEGGRAVLVRVNPELPLADDKDVTRHTLPVLSKGLDAVRAIDAALRERAGPRLRPLDGFDSLDALDFSWVEDDEDEAGWVAAGGKACTAEGDGGGASGSGTGASNGALGKADELITALERTRHMFDRFDKLGAKLGLKPP